MSKQDCMPRGTLLTGRGGGTALQRSVPAVERWGWYQLRQCTRRRTGRTAARGTAAHRGKTQGSTTLQCDLAVVTHLGVCELLHRLEPCVRLLQEDVLVPLNFRVAAAAGLKGLAAW